MRLVFIGASKFGLKCLEQCLKNTDVKVTGIVTAPKKFSISYRKSGVNNVLHADFHSIATDFGIPLEELKESMKDELLLNKIKDWKPDIFLVVGWYHMIPKKWREIAPAYGIHASLLPDYSGGAPLVWAIINGEKRTGVTLFQMDGGVDSGLIAGQKSVSIADNETIATLYNKIEILGIELLNEVLPRIVNGTLSLIAQNHSKRRTFPQRSPEDGKIDWEWDADFIIRFIRAQTKPYPGAFTYLNNSKLYIWSATLSSIQEKGEPGVIKSLFNGKYVIFCGNGLIEIESVTYKSIEYNSSNIAQIFDDTNLAFN